MEEKEEKKLERRRKRNNPTVRNGALHVLVNTVVFRADSRTLNPCCGFSYLRYTVTRHIS